MYASVQSFSGSGWPDPTAPPAVQTCQQAEVDCRKTASTDAGAQACEMTYSGCLQKALSPQQNTARTRSILFVVGLGVAGYTVARTTKSKHPVAWGVGVAAVPVVFMAYALSTLQ